jgi:phospholipid/cholesterol/gamma-HCH transport system substrate-binding protein
VRTGIGRVGAIAAITVGTVAIVVVLLSGGKSYTVDFHFQNASQLVKGDLVQIGGSAVGTIKSIELTDRGEARVRAQIDKDYAPLREGTHAVVRQASLSGVANRYIDLELPSGNPKEIPDGGQISAADTTTAVDLDQLFNVFRKPERRALSDVIRGFATTYAGRGQQANRGFL